MKNPLHGFTIAVTGDFGTSRTHENMKRWTESNGGKFSRDIDRYVTHLVCSKQDFRSKTHFVQQAMRIPSIKIVSYDWLEDSLILQRRLPEEPYYLMRSRAKRAAEEQAKKKRTRRQNIKKGLKLFERGCQEFKEVMGCDGYQIYRDHTSFLYDITLVRANLLENTNRAYHLKVRPPPLPSFFSTPIFPMPRPGRIRRARVHIINVRAQRLQLYESHAVPKTYACFVRYSEPDRTLAEPLAPVGSTFEQAMNVFKMFFWLKTQRPWEERTKTGIMDPDAFTYRPPGKKAAKGVVESEERDAEALKSIMRQVEAREWGLAIGEYEYSGPSY